MGHQLGDGLADTEGGNVDHAHVEGDALLHDLADAAIHGNGAELGLQGTPATVLHASHDVASAVLMGDGRHLAAFAAQDVHDADAVLLGDQLLKGVETHVVGEGAGDEFAHD